MCSIRVFFLFYPVQDKGVHHYRRRKKKRNGEKVSVDEVKRLSHPECLNVSVLGAILR